ncbi:MAG: sodium:solute symporter family protein [Saprospiraceae bacterium]
MKKSLPTILLIGVLTFFGLYLHFFTESDVFWPGYISMMFFYILIFYFGTFLARKKEGSDDLMLGGRKMPLWIAIFTMSATWIGGGYINGTAESTFAEGYGLVWVQAPWGYALSLVIGGLFFARKMREYNFKTMLDPLAQRFGNRMGAVLFLPALTGEIFWTAAILTALGATFSTVLGIDMTSSIILSAIVAIVYTMVGGLWAVALTDVIQLSLILVGLAVIVPFALSETGGWDVVWEGYKVKHGAAASFLPSKAALGNYYWQWWDYALLLMLGGIPWQVYFQRVLASKDGKTAVRLSLLAGIVCIVAAIPAVMIGIIGSSVEDWSVYGKALERNDLILPYVVRYLTPTAVVTVGLGAIAAAVMSSVDSSVLSASSLASWNVYRPLFKPDINQDQLNKAIKTSIWIIGIAATLIALNVQSVYALWFLCSDFVYCLLFPQLVTALFDKKANTIGSICGFVIGVILRFGGGEAALNIPILIDYPMIEEGVVLFPFRTLAMVSSLLTIIIVSRLTQKWSKARVLKVAEEEVL